MTKSVYLPEEVWEVVERYAARLETDKRSNGTSRAIRKLVLEADKHMGRLEVVK